jgi:hypothetical protein
MGRVLKTAISGWKNGFPKIHKWFWSIQYIVCLIEKTEKRLVKFWVFGGASHKKDRSMSIVIF